LSPAANRGLAHGAQASIQGRVAYSDQLISAATRRTIAGQQNYSHSAAPNFTFQGISLKYYPS